MKSLICCCLGETSFRSQSCPNPFKVSRKYKHVSMYIPLWMCSFVSNGNLSKTKALPKNDKTNMYKKESLEERKYIYLFLFCFYL